MSISWPTGTKTIIDQIRGAIGRNVSFYVVDTQEICPVCGFESISESALDPFCITCSGAGYLYTYRPVTISGHITWGYSEMIQWTAGGQQNSGDCRVQIEYTQANLDAVEDAKWVEVDGKQMQVIKKILRGVPAINRILVDLIEKEKE